MKMEERIEAAASAYLDALGLDGESSSSLREDAIRILRAGFPEFFTDPPDGE